MSKGQPRVQANAAANQTAPAAALTLRGTVKKGAAVANAVAAPTKAEFDALLGSLRAAGIIAT